MERYGIAVKAGQFKATKTTKIGRKWKTEDLGPFRASHSEARSDIETAGGSLPVFNFKGRR